ncbi:reductive dehalogenase domain-containing protein [Marivivens marinus]|uniref:reductive dehalogenase domain-containing protein n=1 Tax=Marivivens marinus TaxID=3110173 RepID=UPI003B84B1D8
MTRANAIPQHLLDSDAAAGFEITEDFERFDQMNDMFTRAFWDDSVRSPDTDAFFNSYRMEAAPRRGEGFSQRDFALRNAAWAVSDIISNRAAAEGVREGFQGAIRNDTPAAPERVTLGSEAEEAREIKRLAAFFGADLCGITHLDERWHYSRVPDTRDMSARPNELPEGLTHVIVMGHEMDAGLVDTYPSALAGAATGREYSHETAIVIQLAAYIRNLGFQAVASMNDTALAIPYAIKAGLGEYGRNQMVLTPEFGPRVRFSKIFTDMPLAVDAPRQLGLASYCTICTKCAEACPPRALPNGPPAVGSDSPSTIRGVRKWSANCEKCFGYWAKLRSDCAICMRVCPFNRGQGTWADRIWYYLATTSRWRALALWVENRRGLRKRLRPRDWWAGNQGR